MVRRKIRNRQLFDGTPKTEKRWVKKGTKGTHDGSVGTVCQPTTHSWGSGVGRRVGGVRTAPRGSPADPGPTSESDLDRTEWSCAVPHPVGVRV